MQAEPVFALAVFFVPIFAGCAGANYKIGAFC